MTPRLYIDRQINAYLGSALSDDETERAKRLGDLQLALLLLSGVRGSTTSTMAKRVDLAMSELLSALDELRSIVPTDYPRPI